MFAPFHRPSERQQLFLTRQLRQDRKRQRLDQEDDGEEDDDGADDGAVTSSHTWQKNAANSASFRPVNRTDPYHVAGYSREEGLPPGPFPHAPILPPKKSVQPIEEELAALNPPLHLPKGLHAQPTSLKRLHATNLTAIVHHCMLKGDWQRASRAWALLLRTEIAGRGPALRHNARWTMGAELLMRRDQTDFKATVSSANDDDDDNNKTNNDEDVDRHSDGAGRSNDVKISDKGFSLVKEYYERLILQYPHTRGSQHSVTSLAIYPALFNVWTYQIQDQAKRALRQSHLDRSSSDDDEAQSHLNRSTMEEGHDKVDDDERLQVRTRELGEAQQLVDRMDELLQSPPYDTSLPLLRLRGMVGLWLADLKDSVHGERFGEAERKKATEILRRADAAGGEIPPFVLAHLDEISNDANDV